MASRSSVSPAIFVASILSFALPFISVSCNGQKVASFAGVELAAGTTVNQPQTFGPPRKQTVNPEPTATIAAFLAVLGIGLSFIGPKGAIATGVTGALGAISLLFMKSQVDNRIFNQGHGMFQ